MPSVSIKNENSYEIKEGENLYNALENQGKVLPHGCLSGSCGACRILVHEGSENLSDKSVVEENTIDSLQRSYDEKGIDLGGKEIRLACKVKVLGNITLEPLK